MSKNWIWVLLISTFAACSTDGGSFEIGEDLVKPESKVLLSDSFDVTLSSIQIDSLRASSLEEAVIGNYYHPLSGEVNYTHFFNVGVATIKEDVVFDSISVIIGYSGYSLGDTLKSIELSVYQIDNELDIYDHPDYKTDYNYNTTKYSYGEENILGSKQFSVRPSNDSIEIKLDKAFGQEVFDWLYNDESAVDKVQRFSQFTRGFAISKTGGNDLLFGINSTSSASKPKVLIRLYAHEKGLDLKRKTYDLNLSTQNSNYSMVSVDRSGTKFEGLTNQKTPIAANLVDGVSLIQAGAGVMTKISFPTINNLFYIDKTTMIRAELILVPDKKSNDLKNLPKKLYFYQTNRDNQYIESSVLVDGSNNIMYATLKEDAVDISYYYAIDITNYMIRQLANSNYDETKGLVVAFAGDDMKSTSEILFLNEKERMGGIKTKLNLYLLQNE